MIQGVEDEILGLKPHLKRVRPGKLCYVRDVRPERLDPCQDGKDKQLPDALWLDDPPGLARSAV